VENAVIVIWRVFRYYDLAGKKGRAKMEIGNQIKSLRTQRGITQDALAEKLGVSAQAVSKSWPSFWKDIDGLSMREVLFNAKR